MPWLTFSILASFIIKIRVLQSKNSPDNQVVTSLKGNSSVRHRDSAFEMFLKEWVLKPHKGTSKQNLKQMLEDSTLFIQLQQN
jgi:hypothetical protein